MTLLVHAISDLRAELAGRANVGLVPTMGALHDGHLSLVRRASKESEVVVVTIFVNPTQFNDPSDLETYPRTLEVDVELAGEAGADIIFAPSVDEMYPDGSTETVVSAGRLSEIVEGEFRPGHFDGVATVCVKLFSIVGPDRAYFGEKDAQQLAVIRKVVEDLNLPLEIVGCPTVREGDGLAMSSRNAHLSPSDRKAATAISQALFEAKDLIAEGETSPESVAKHASDVIQTQEGLEVQYVAVVDPTNFEVPDKIEGEVIVAVAAFASQTRLIDNVRADVGTRKGLN